jgi:hypothetical protein
MNPPIGVLNVDTLTPVPGTLASRLADADEDRFVGRRPELQFFDRALDGELDVAVVLVHGRAGIGKSTLLREVARRGIKRGWQPRIVEGRDLAPVPGELERALEGLQHEERPLLLIDTYERMSAAGGYLRQRFLPMLPEGALVVIATRTSPESAWFEGGWERLVHELPLTEMPVDDARALVTEHGVADARRADEIVAWADGSPLALALAADAATAEPRWQPIRSPDPPEIVRALIRRITAAELDAAHRGAIAVGALARVVTVDLVRDVLPGVDAVEAYEWLASRTFSEPLGDGLTLHDRVRRALRAELRRSDPERERELRRRIADHLYTEAMSGQPRLTIDVADLVENPTIRALYSWDGAAQYRIDGVRPGDAVVVATLMRGRKLHAWWEATRPFFEHAPQCVAIARDATDQLVGYLIAVTPDNAPDFADDDPLIGPWLRHARATIPDGNVILWRDAVDFTTGPEDAARSEVQAMVNMAGVLRSGLANPRYAYLPVDPAYEQASEFTTLLGAEHLQDLDLGGEHSVQCHRVDYGPGGLLGLQRIVIYGELGLTPPAVPPVVDGAASRAVAPPPEPFDAEAVRDALRSLSRPLELARNPLATGATPEERAASVRARLETAAEHAFGASDDDQLLRAVLRRGYLEPAGSHEQAADELFLSRATYFRRLRAAAARLADYLVASQ